MNRIVTAGRVERICAHAVVTHMEHDTTSSAMEKITSRKIGCLISLKKVITSVVLLEEETWNKKIGYYQIGIFCDVIWNTK